MMGRRAKSKGSTALEARPSPLLPMRRPWWALALVVMIGFGYVQEDTKVKLNHYMAVGDRYADFYDFGHEECEWDRTCMIEKRKMWWEGYAPLCRTNYAYTRDTYPVFHGWGRSEMTQAKWGLMAFIVLCFFALDALFLRAAGVPERWKVLLLIYAGSGFVTAVFWFADGQAGAEEAGYNVARELLGFLQSPMPSLMLVLLPWLQKRALMGQAQPEERR